ncbi:hemerythrin domain-containing protein [Kribbella italica]|uniref:Hemerythrin-like domain-containing protein n=1 Tax=Kribbella italica TaxID=1540520 RepID=A0A7W9J5K1_9ACTN|nr:hemerythrin domain-containing protein [Kribbella italica]MBB5836046.1 hemerythrin-like domain-containing protein [Kribbella italica]
MSTDTKPDTQTMVVVHRVFRREFDLLPDLIDGVRAGDTERAAVLAEHLTDVVAALHHHHQAEDDLVWPLLLERATLHVDLVHRMEAQHTALGAALDRIEKLTPQWRRGASLVEGRELAAAVREASAILREHMGEEETEILPVITEHLSVEEWAEVGERAGKSIQDKRKRLLFLGAILEDASPQEQRDFLGELPPPVRLLWRIAGRRAYGGYTRLIRNY